MNSWKGWGWRVSLIRGEFLFAGQIRSFHFTSIVYCGRAVLSRTRNVLLMAVIMLTERLSINY